MMNKRKTALVLSGGGSRGSYQCGVWQALIELGIDIDIVIGVSVGSINGAMVVQGDAVKTANLWRELETHMIFDVESGANYQDFAKEAIRHQGIGSTGLQHLLHQYVDEAAIRNAPVDYGLLVVELPGMKPHYLWKEDIPEGQLCDYITASSSVYPVIHAHKIGDKEFIDGGYEDVMPAFMALEKGATDIICVHLSALGRFHPERLEGLPNLTVIRSQWELGDVLLFTHEKAKWLLRLGYLDTMKTFGIYDGELYTFVKGAFDKRTMHQADLAAQLFDLDPTILYRPETFRERLEQEVRKVRDTLDTELDIEELNLKTIKELMKNVNMNVATILIADEIKEKGENSFFLHKYIRKLFPKRINAAILLAKWDL